MSMTVLRTQRLNAETGRYDRGLFRQYDVERFMIWLGMVRSEIAWLAVTNCRVSH